MAWLVCSAHQCRSASRLTLRCRSWRCCRHVNGSRRTATQINRIITETMGRRHRSLRCGGIFGPITSPRQLQHKPRAGLKPTTPTRSGSAVLCVAQKSVAAKSICSFLDDHGWIVTAAREPVSKMRADCLLCCARQPKHTLSRK